MHYIVSNAVCSVQCTLSSETCSVIVCNEKGGGEGSVNYDTDFYDNVGVTNYRLVNSYDIHEILVTKL